MTSEITTDAVRAAEDTADLLDAWGEVNLEQGREGQSKDMAKAATAMRDLATAYLALAEENERLRRDLDDARGVALCAWQSWKANNFDVSGNQRALLALGLQVGNAVYNMEEGQT